MAQLSVDLAAVVLTTLLFIPFPPCPQTKKSEGKRGNSSKIYAEFNHSSQPKMSLEIFFKSVKFLTVQCAAIEKTWRAPFLAGQFISYLTGLKMILITSP